MTISTVENNQIQVLMAEMQLMKANNNNLESKIEAKFEAKLSKFEPKLAKFKTRLAKFKTRLEESEARLDASERNRRDLRTHINKRAKILEEQAKTLACLKSSVAKLESEGCETERRVSKLEGLALATYNCISAGIIINPNKS